MTVKVAVRLSFWLAIAVSFVMAMLPNPIPVAVSDKTQHFLLFSALTLLAVAAYPHAQLRMLAIGLAGFGSIIEICQATVARGRSGELLDWVADLGGIGTVWAAIWLFRRAGKSINLTDRRLPVRPARAAEASENPVNST